MHLQRKNVGRDVFMIAAQHSMMQYSMAWCSMAWHNWLSGRRMAQHGMMQSMYM